VVGLEVEGHGKGAESMLLILDHFEALLAVQAFFAFAASIAAIVHNLEVIPHTALFFWKKSTIFFAKFNFRCKNLNSYMSFALLGLGLGAQVRPGGHRHITEVLVDIWRFHSHLDKNTKMLSTLSSIPKRHFSPTSLRLFSCISLYSCLWHLAM
jgi:hypothetical protein